jgi:predicted CopG family antitoxin
MVYYIVAMVTTIQVSGELLEQLKTMKLSEKESYEDIIWGMVEDRKELSEETRRAVEEARSQVAKGRFYTHEQVRKELGF